MKQPFPLRSLSIVIVLSALGAMVSVPVSYMGSLLSALQVFPIAIPQLFAGLHVFWLVLVALLVRTRGAATLAGACKGLLEAAFFSRLGVIALGLSLVEGLLVDFVFLFLKKEEKAGVLIAGGISSASNLAILQLLLLPSLSLEVLGLAYVAAFISGVVFGSALSLKVFKVVPKELFASNGQKMTSDRVPD